MFGRTRSISNQTIPADAPVLDLSGPRLRSSLSALISRCEMDGGIEHYVDAVGLKSQLFRTTLVEDGGALLNDESLKLVCAFIAPARRRLFAALGDDGLASIREAVATLVRDMDDVAGTDARVAAFCALFPDDRKHRWVRDMAGEILHFAAPDAYPLMCRWIWDVQTNTGAVREIWYGEDLDNRILDVPDTHATFAALYAELGEFLADNGVFRDIPFYTDLLLAQVYAEYLGARGDALLKSDFGSDEDPMMYVRHMLGLDAVDSKSRRTKLKPADGTAHVVDEDLLLAAGRRN
jgi:hypothetical protein